MQDIFGAVDLTSVLTWIVALGVLIIGIAMAFVGIDLGKRAIHMVDGNYIAAEDRPENWDQDDWDQNYSEGFERDQERYRD